MEGVEEIFAEAVNPRGNGLILTQQALEKSGYEKEAAEIEKVRKRKDWNRYVVELIETIQHDVRKHTSIDKLRILSIPKV